MSLSSIPANGSASSDCKVSFESGVGSASVVGAGSASVVGAGSASVVGTTCGEVGLSGRVSVVGAGSASVVGAGSASVVVGVSSGAGSLLDSIILVGCETDSLVVTDLESSSSLLSSSSSSSSSSGRPLDIHSRIRSAKIIASSSF